MPVIVVIVLHRGRMRNCALVDDGGVGFVLGRVDLNQPVKTAGLECRADVVRQCTQGQASASILRAACSITLRPVLLM